MNYHLFVILFFMSNVPCIDTKKLFRNEKTKGGRFRGSLLQPTDFSKMVTPKVILDSLTEAGVDPDDIQRPAKKFLLDLYNKLENGGKMSETLPGGAILHESLKNADTVRSLTAKVPVYEGSGKVKLTFNLSSLSNTEVAHHAELHIRPLQENHEKHRHKFRFTILNESGRKGQQMTFRISSKSKTYDGYLVFNITDVIQKLIVRSFNYAEKLLEVVVSHKAVHKRMKTKRNNNGQVNKSRGKRSLQPIMKEDDGILLLYTKDRSFFDKFSSQVKYASTKTFTHDKQLMRRRKRDANSQFIQNEATDAETKRVRRSTKKDCDKGEFVVDFQKLGWNKWIIFPHTYNAFLCEGKCSSPVDWSLNPTNHAVLQSLMRMSDRTVPKPCCVPSKLDSLSMIYFEYDEIVVRHHDGMVVSKCGCR